MTTPKHRVQQPALRDAGARPAPLSEKVLESDPDRAETGEVSQPKPRPGRDNARDEKETVPARPTKEN